MSRRPRVSLPAATAAVIAARLAILDATTPRERRAAHDRLDEAMRDRANAVNRAATARRRALYAAARAAMPSVTLQLARKARRAAAGRGTRPRRRPVAAAAAA